MFLKFFSLLINLLPSLRRKIWHWWYQIIAKKYQLPNWKFMNYGYAELSGQKLDLKGASEEDRYFIQLYHYVAAAVDLKDKKVLEVGSGRGGGANYITRIMKPSEMVGLDYSANAVKLANKDNARDNLTFKEGDAENLPFRDNAFDVILNVESSHCYGNMQQFVKEINRVVKPGGYFSWADLRGTEEKTQLPNIFTSAGLIIKEKNTITPQVLHALDLIHDLKMKMIADNISSFIQPVFRNFAGVKGSQIYNAFKNNSIVYLHFLLQKPT